MKHQNHKRSGIFLLEIMIAILFFALTSAVCLRSFVKSHTLSTQAADTEQALSRLEDIAELINTIAAADLKDEKTFSETVKAEFPSAKTNGRNAVIYYNSNWKICSQDAASYQIRLQTTDTEDSMCNFKLRALKLAGKNVEKSSVGKEDRTASEITHLTLKRYAKD